MAEAKKAAPIARPLSKAYLREFSGLSTAYPPGVSEPNSLRIMENAQIMADGAVAVRPALRSVLNEDEWLDTTHNVTAVGSFDPFFLNDGSKALLFAVREADDTVGFRVAVYNGVTFRYTVVSLTTHFSVPQTEAVLNFSSATTYVRYVQVDNKIFALSDSGEEMRVFWVGVDKVAKKLTEVTRPNYDNDDRLTVVHPVASWISGSQTTIPTAETKTTTTLISSTSADNVYNFAYFYTFNTEIGESAPSRLRVVKVQRSLSQWDEDASDDTLSPDQLVASIPSGAWDDALAQGAISWNLYMITWSDQDAVPVEAVLLKTTTMEGSITRDTNGWASHTPLVEGLDSTMGLPNSSNRVNYTTPAKAAQGIVAGDRLILVNDLANPAVIRWSSNQQGEYTNFSASKGGGYKTLTSGNLYIPATVKLWQDPQSVDTITVLCMGVDGYSTSYFMQPASVSGSSGSVQIMGFEETTATPGTVSPYGCEVLNNALYHPLDWELMKSTASNYNITHKSMTDMIQNMWGDFANKERIVSAQIDNKLYYLVQNPYGEELAPGCNGNEIWVCDTELENVWSRWLVPAVSLHKIEIGGHTRMGVMQVDGLMIFDDEETLDEYNNAGVTAERAIPWVIETNTQGANRAHDAWCRLEQAGIVLGNYRGTLRWGIRGYDRHGKAVEISKVYRMTDPTASVAERFDHEDYLKIQKDLKEWRFFAQSEGSESSYGQVSLVQYRYTPITVNVGYQYGSVETFEYGRTEAQTYTGISDNGIPTPMLDTGRP